MKSEASTLHTSCFYYKSRELLDLPKLQNSVRDAGSRLHHNTTRHEK